MRASCPTPFWNLLRARGAHKSPQLAICAFNSHIFWPVNTRIHPTHILATTPRTGPALSGPLHTRQPAPHARHLRASNTQVWHNRGLLNRSQNFPASGAAAPARPSSCRRVGGDSDSRDAGRGIQPANLTPRCIAGCNGHRRAPLSWHRPRCAAHLSARTPAGQA